MRSVRDEVFTTMRSVRDEVFTKNNGEGKVGTGEGV
jgi:hypothetical protein